jgi:transglutaminase-like putative cysteine protease
LTVTGENFGDTQEGAYLTIANMNPTLSSYIEWTDSRIRVRIPDFGESALVRFHRKNKTSAPRLIFHRESLPLPVEEDGIGRTPRILSVEPASGSIGDLIILQGSNFGFTRNGSGVFFTRETETGPGENLPGVEVFENEFGYEQWHDKEIQVRIPDGAVSGNLEVRTLRGNSAPVFFEVTGKPGAKVYQDRLTYEVSYNVEIQTGKNSGPNTLYLWFPHPVVSASQPVVQHLRRTEEPFVENYRDTTLFKLNDMQKNTTRMIALSYRVEVYAVETQVNSAQIRSRGTSPIKTVYTLPGPLIPSDDPGIEAKAAEIIQREQNPYLKARRLYEWLIDQGGIGQEPQEGGAVEALERGQADSYGAALLFCALARAAAVPAIPLSGVLIREDRSTSRHFWAEFWIDGFGWVPLDPVLGAGRAPPDFELPENPRQYYFGNLDNRRVAFTRDQTVLSRMEVRGKTVSRDREYALQNFWEEALGEAESYTSLWSDVIIETAERPSEPGAAIPIERRSR